jgi:cell wall-associated NlpC family hydrolase
MSIFVCCTATALLPSVAQAAPAGFAGRPVQVVAAPNTVARAAVRFALELRGVPYVWAGSSPAGFDCSGFTRYVYGHFGVRLPHSSYAQWTAGRHIPRSRLLPGDLVFFGTGHVGLWLGHGRFIHAPHTGAVVSVERLAASWYENSLSGGVRVSGSQRPLRAPARPARRPTSSAWSRHK